MKKLFLAFLFIVLSVPLFSQETEPNTIDGGKFNFVFDEGVSYAQVTRVEHQTNRSNFVRENMMIGAFFNFQTVNLSKLDFIEQVSVYYPFYNAFNGMRQFPKNMFNYAIDNFTGITADYKKLKYINFDFSLGMHYMFQMTDEWPMSYLGIGLQTGMNFPISRYWTILNTYLISFDNANIGPNKLMQPFEISYQYHINLGVRYSRRAPNTYCYIKPKSL